jgi:menaquinone-dependent protoporphyrinogen oxidase
MPSFLVLYGTGEGQTAKTASRIAESIEGRGHDATALDIEELPTGFSLTEYDAVVVGSSIHVGKHHERIREFVSVNRDALRTRPTAFFQLSLSSATDDPERREEAAAYVDTLLEEANWHPDRIGLFGGALRYSKYGFLKRLMMKRIAREATGDVDTSKDHEYTDWAAVEAFANDFAAYAEGRLGD